MESDSAGRLRVFGNRYARRRAGGKAGWADEASYLLKQSRLDDILAEWRLPQRRRILEMGCGNGNVTLYASGKGHEAYGIDIVPEAIAWANEQARERQVEAHFAVGSVVTLTPYADDFFDFVFDANCLFMILGPDREKCVGNVSRVLRRGGLFYAEAHLVNEEITTRAPFGAAGDYFDPEGQYSTVQGQPAYYYSREREFLGLIEGGGFRIVKQVKETRTSDYPPHCAGDMWVVAVKA